jgi:hypothetical protein
VVKKEDYGESEPVRVEDMNGLVKCTSCGWIGDKSRLIERQGDLLLHDHTMNLIYDMGVTRWNLHCPQCTTVLKSVRKFAEEAAKAKP